MGVRTEPFLARASSKVTVLSMGQPPACSPVLVRKTLLNFISLLTRHNNCGNILVCNTLIVCVLLRFTIKIHSHMTTQFLVPCNSDKPGKELGSPDGWMRERERATVNPHTVEWQGSDYSPATLISVSATVPQGTVIEWHTYELFPTKRFIVCATKITSHRFSCQICGRLAVLL